MKIAMKRHVAKLAHRIVLFLLLISGGAIINIAVAWTIEARTPLYTNPVTLMTRAESRAFVTSRVGAANDDDSLGMQGSAFGAARTTVPYSRTDAGMTVYAFAYDWRYGWPMRSLMTDAQVSGTGRPETPPTRPIWPGFEINTIFYAAILWLPFTAFGRIRRRIRAHRGRCIACGYDLRGRERGRGEADASNACPECGAVSSQRTDAKNAS